MASPWDFVDNLSRDLSPRRDSGFSDGQLDQGLSPEELPNVRGELADKCFALIIREFLPSPAERVELFLLRGIFHSLARCANCHVAQPADFRYLPIAGARMFRDH